ncbi:pentatricopeptide repeat-containing protein At5g67570, chloroplastic isoform X2 [Phragmites australis]|uniref:pentatricopeptide repeat-containing protein At5g67570, chloroplastic isoform X2 n=1 Tax=Phragmites australis TaxID=29695 RepID=UPI002D786667|nr:pentatricopeptide repeat-containing protein At5g67570, chloroplastic isoform X2 [Phragmites australis]
MAVPSPSLRFHLSLNLQNTNPNHSSPSRKPHPAPTTETLRRRLLRKGVSPTPKILHALRKKEALKSLRRARKDTAAAAVAPSDEALDADEEASFRAAAAEYRALVGRPWDGAARGAAPPRGSCGGDEEGLEGLREMLLARRGDGFRWLLDDDLEVAAAEGKQRRLVSDRSAETEDEERRIELLVTSLNEDDLTSRDWRLTRMMRKADIMYNEDNLLRILNGLEARGNWRQALSITEWVYNENIYRHRKSRFVYTKLLSILGKSSRATEALRVFTIMQKPSKKVMKMRRKDWDPSLEPDVLIYNSVLNACVLSQQWKGVFWVFQQMRLSGLSPTGASFGLAMEVMLKAKKYDFVQKFYEKMQKNGVPPRAITYKVLVRALWEQRKINEAVEAVTDMEQRGIVGAACVYYELACCLCNNGRWRDAMSQVQKLKQHPLTKPLEYTFTGMILASFDGGYIYECISIFESMKDQCTPNIGTVNVMLKVYGRCDMFGKAKDLFETTKACFSGSQTYDHEHSSFKADAYTYSSMLEASASAQQWEYFEYVYREMALSHHHLAQSKYSWLLIKASRAGKPYLLEHALDLILERGEIPDVQLFAETISQSIARRDYGRTLQLLNVMSDASISVNELQWCNLLQNNVHLFSMDSLKDLIKYLSTSATISADPALSFVRALKSQCGTALVKGTYLLADDTSNKQCEISLLKNASSSSLAGQDQLTCQNLCSNILLDVEGSGEVPDSDRDAPQLGASAVMSREISFCAPRLENKREQWNLRRWGTQASAIDEVLDSMNSYGHSSYREMPSSSEILELWEQERINDMFAPKTESRTTPRG